MTLYLLLFFFVNTIWFRLKNRGNFWFLIWEFVKIYWSWQAQIAIDIFVPSHLYLFQFLKNIKNIAAARKVLKEVLKVSEDKKKVSTSEAITFPFEILIKILDKFYCHLLLPAMLSELLKNSSCNFDQKYQIGFAFIIFLLWMWHFRTFI